MSKHWGVVGDASPLPGDRDRNFRISGRDGGCWVFKAAHDFGTERQDHETQREVLEALRARWKNGTPPFPQVLASRSGGPVLEPDGSGNPCILRLVDYLEGTPLAETVRRPPVLYRRIGRLLGRMQGILHEMPDGMGARRFEWDLRGAHHLVDTHRHLTREPDRGAILDSVREDWDDRAHRFTEILSTSLIHNDANDHNILVDWGVGAAPADHTPRVSGLIDFGDMVRSWRVAEVAVAGAYLILSRPDPLAVLEPLVSGFDECCPLQEVELAAVLPLLKLRLALSVSMSAYQAGLRPDDPYLRVSQAPAWEALSVLEAIPDGLAEAHLRRCVGLEPSRAGGGLRRRLVAGEFDPAPVLPGLHAATLATIDLSPGSLELAELPEGAPPSAWARVVDETLEEGGAEVGVGRYDEPRRWYSSKLFQGQGNDGPTQRSVHLGIDLFAPAGTPVHAPLEGTVHSVGVNEGELDYGPAVILEHSGAGSPGEEGDGPGRSSSFFTLYGHLALDSVGHLESGRKVSRGEVIGALGSEAENGGWAPHLHFQVVSDMLGFRGQFPGVARPTHREVWLSLSPDPAGLLGISVPPPRGDPELSSQQILNYRAQHLGPNLSVAYRRPVQIVRGWMQHLFDQNGQPFLDGVNNVAHVGHSHPRVVEAARRQMGVLNTNTRYLHEQIVRYSRDLLSTLPEPLRVVYLVCSGSEANELALRLARAHSGRRDLVVLEAAYHGNTGLLVEASGYKSEGPGGEGPGEWVHTAPLPDGYRGIYRRSQSQGAGGPGAQSLGSQSLGGRYASEVVRVVDEAAAKGRPVGAFLAESLPGCGGQIVLPEGFLSEAYLAIRSAGGVCIADEVQVGFGRAGSHFWGFETQGVVPDIVTMGKPMGNGHPLGAVVTTEEIAASFDNGMEYFNTFGGNPVSCAVGRAVLEVIRSEELQEQAARVGARLKGGLQDLAGRHPLIGEVRGLGLYLGVELVTDRDARTPAGPHAAYVVNRLRDKGILLSTDGPDHNVVKIKPPLPFTFEDADRLVHALDEVLREEPVRALT